MSKTWVKAEARRMCSCKGDRCRPGGASGGSSVGAWEVHMPGRAPSAPRCAAIVGPYLSGKTALFESLLFATGAIHRKGNAKEGTTVGDASPEARARKMSVETVAATAEFLGEKWTFIDCPGSVELSQDTRNALMVCDVAIVVAE